MSLHAVQQPMYRNAFATIIALSLTTTGFACSENVTELQQTEGTTEGVDSGNDEQAPDSPSAKQDPCAGLDYCACAAEPACRPESEPCYCPETDCEGNSISCYCAGGDYLGCRLAKEPEPDDHQDVLFEVSYFNIAWGANWRGIAIDSSGSVRQWEFGPSDPLPSKLSGTYPRGITKEALLLRYGTTSLVGTIPTEALRQKAALVDQANAGTLLRQSRCADAGSYTITVWSHDENTDLYSPTLLEVHGDEAVRNTSPEAKLLVQWLETLSKPPHGVGCEFSTRSCLGNTCDDAPSCPEHSVPVQEQSADVCLSGCGSAQECAEVQNCDTCNSRGMLCVKDQEAKLHCAPAVVPDARSCAEVGDWLCAGGKAYCQGEAATGLRCIAP